MNHPESAPTERRPATPVRHPFHIDGQLYFPLETTLPLDQCIRCGNPPSRTVLKAIRHAKSPRTWFGKVPKVEVALCRKHYDDLRVARALTWSLLGLGVLLIVVGAVSYSFLTMGFGILVALASGFFRARETIQGRDVGNEIYEIRGACDSFVRRLPEHRRVEGGGSSLFLPE